MTDINSAAELPTTRRGVLWLGLRCDMSCHFCYDEMVPKERKGWVPVGKATQALDKFRGYYQNEFVDFMGGEPTLHPDILTIVGHSASIGLKPTLITHGMHLAKKSFAQALRDAGVHDFLISVHAIGDRVHSIHRRGRDNFEKQQQGIENLRELGVPFRFNTTVVRDNLDQLEDVARFAAETGARVVNFLTFNPHFEWSQEDPPFQVQHSESGPVLQRAIDILTEAGVEANIRYMPLCTMRGYEQHVFTQHQLPYDTHEWDYNSWYDVGRAGLPDGDWYRWAAGVQSKRHGYVYADACKGCAMQPICDGVNQQYLERFGDGELTPYEGPLVTDPTHFVRHQPVIAEEVVSDVPPVDHDLASRLHLSQFREGFENRDDYGHRGGISVEILPRRKQS